MFSFSTPFVVVPDHQQGQEGPDRGGGDPAEIRAAPQHHHSQGRESLYLYFITPLTDKSILKAAVLL